MSLVAQERYSISGRITDEVGNGMPGLIDLHELQREARADESGYFNISGLKQGTYHLHVHMMGYQAVAHTLILRTTVKELNFQLAPSIFYLQELIIEANPFKNGSLEQSQMVEVLDRTYLERNSAGTFANAIEKIPGVSTINTGVGISKPVIRGLSFNRILINDKGIKQEGQQWGADHGLEIDPYDVDRIEIIKGPGSLVYGSDGMAGVINIIAAPFPEEGTWDMEVMSTYRHNNRMLGHSVMTEGREGDVLFRGRFTMQDFQDYQVPTDQFNYASFILPVFDQRLKNTAGRERHFSFTSGISKDWGQSTVTVSQFHQKSGIFPGAVGIPNSYSLTHRGDHKNIETPFQDNTHQKIISNTKLIVGKNWLEVDLGYQENVRQENSLPHTHGVGPTPEGTLSLGLNLQTYTANLRYNFAQSESRQRIVGLQWQHMVNRKDGFEFLLPDFSTSQLGVFYFEEYKITQELIFNAGLRAESARHQVSEHLQPIYQRLQPTGEFDQRNPEINRSLGNFSGATGLSWVINDRQNLKVNAGTSFRIPTAIELASNGVHHGNFRHEKGNSDLSSERSYQMDISYAYKGKKVYFMASPFISYYDQYIYLGPTGRFSQLPASSMLWEYRQSNAIFGGGEVKSEISLLDNLQLSIAGEYVWNVNTETNLPLPLTPPLSLLSRVEYEWLKPFRFFKSFFLYAEYRGVSSQNRVDRNERSTPAYGLWEAGFRTDLLVAGQIVKIFVNGQNLTNQFYFNHLSRYRLLNLPEQGRNISVSVKIPLSIKG